MVRFSGEIVMKDKSSAQQNGIASRFSGEIVFEEQLFSAVGTLLSVDFLAKNMNTGMAIIMSDPFIYLRRSSWLKIAFVCLK